MMLAWTFARRHSGYQERGRNGEAEAVSQPVR